MQDIKDIEDIKWVVDNFYLKARQDDLLKPVFESRVADDAWEKHLTKMYSFWNTVLFFQKGYKGNPFSKHSDLPIEDIHFKRWVKLFSETIEERFEGVVATDAKVSAKRMGQVFLAKLNYLKENPQQISIM